MLAKNSTNERNQPYLRIGSVGTHQGAKVLLRIIHRNDSAMETLATDVLDHFQPFIIGTGLDEDVVKVGEGVVLSCRGHHFLHLLGVLHAGTHRVVDVVDLLAEHGAVDHASVHDEHVVSVFEGSLFVGRKG